MRYFYLFQFLLILTFIPHEAVTQPVKKQISAHLIDNPPKIDGILDEPIWDNKQCAKDFIQVEPYTGQPSRLPSEVIFLYDNSALYIGAKLFDNNPDSILRELSVRDQLANCDYFGVYIDPFNDALNAFGFIVTSAGVQCDLKKDMNDEEEGGGHDGDWSWDAVWHSAVKTGDSGWVVEMKIPYSAIRFPAKKEQLWGLNIVRNIRRYREHSSWSFIDRKKMGANYQAGELTGITGIKPPLRLSLIPYVSSYLNKEPNQKRWGFSWKAGMDLKYGINESFTLDMILIPDFGQVESDDEIYNLSPFEVYYGEKRPFFTEGTELFDKDDIFYSRRIGDTPSGYNSVNDSLRQHEIILKNPRETQLLNATKITGKNPKGLAIGFFNAITAKTYSTIKDTISDSERKLLTEPFTNYNMLVMEQALKNNSFISLFNTNVYQPEKKSTANVTGTDFQIVNGKKSYGLYGIAIASQKYIHGHLPETGYKYGIEVGKISGRFTYELTHILITDTYNQNDMGFIERNNLIYNELQLKYNKYDPFWKVVSWQNTLEINYSMLYEPASYTDFGLFAMSMTTFKNYLTVGFNASYQPFDNHDYFEPRVKGYYYTRPSSGSFSFWISPDYRKRFLADVRAGVSKVSSKGEGGYWIFLGPRIRVNDKLFITPEFFFQSDYNDKGYVTDSVNNTSHVVIFGERDLINVTSTIQARYIFTNTASLSLRMRHYWLKGEYDKYFDLQPNGSLKDSDYKGDKDFSYNIFTIDMSYVWQFSPGSELSLVWKNTINRFNGNISEGYWQNISEVMSSPSANSLSVKILYYIDFQSIKSKIKKGKDH